jgi:hypothetical protein
VIKTGLAALMVAQRYCAGRAATKEGNNKKKRKKEEQEKLK